MKICVIFTGGTIGSVLDESGYIGPKEGTTFRVLQMYQDQYGDDIEFEVVEPYRVLSENLSAKHLMCLFETVRSVLRKNVDGVIVTHGTDTLQYGAAMLGYVFGASKVPIVLVSSNYVLDDERANGLTNFYHGVEFIKRNCGRGVFVSYCNEGESPMIHRATRLQPLVPYSDYVASVCDCWYGKFENGHYISNPEYDVKDGQVALFAEEEQVCLTETASQILFIRPYVGMPYPTVKENVQVVLHSSYHSGTICVGENLERFMGQMQERKIPVYLTGLLTGEHAYETVKEYKQMGMIPLQTSGEVAQYCKLWLALSNGLDVWEVMGKPVAEDWI